MEPESSRQPVPCSGEPEPGDLREETPGEEAKDGDSRLREGGGHGRNTAGKMKPECGDEGKTNTQEKCDDDDGGDKYEEELDPRIQAWIDKHTKG